jgi:RNA polymerase sigma-70 factor (TIGR02960 family)
MNASRHDTVPAEQAILAAMSSPPATFDELAARHRRALHVHCYRMAGSFSDADDLVQDALLRAWSARGSYDAATGEVGFRRWLYRIATNVCLDFLKSASRRVVAASSSPSEAPWLQPYPDRLLDELVADDAGPDAAAVAKESIALGYLALIQLLPPQQRAVLVLREVLDWSAAETASALDLTVAAVNSSLQRARDTIGRSGPRPVAPPSDDERTLLAAFIDTHQRGDTAAALALIATDIRITMPPLPQSFVGKDTLAPLLARAFDGTIGEWRLVPTSANRQPAAISYLRRPGDTLFRVFKVDVLHVRDGLIAEITTFNTDLADAFGAPAILPAA